MHRCKLLRFTAFCSGPASHSRHALA